MGCKPLVPLGDEDDGHLEIARAELLENCECAHARMTVFDQEDVVRMTVRANQIERSIDFRDRAGDFDRCAGPAKTFARKRIISHVQELDTTARWTMSAGVRRSRNQGVESRRSTASLCNPVKAYAPLTYRFDTSRATVVGSNF